MLVTAVRIESGFDDYQGNRKAKHRISSEDMLEDEDDELVQSTEVHARMTHTSTPEVETVKQNQIILI
mgnify:CR=1 FL=1